MVSKFWENARAHNDTGICFMGLIYAIIACVICISVEKFLGEVFHEGITCENQ